jgi:hypothetical protein
VTRIALTVAVDGSDVVEASRHLLFRPVGVVRYLLAGSGSGVVSGRSRFAVLNADRASGTVVEVEPKERGTYLTVGCPVKFSDFRPTITDRRYSLSHTDDVLAELGYGPDAIAKMHADHVV